MDKVQSIAMPTLLSKCGFNRNTKRTIVYGPWELGGCTLCNLYVEQGLGVVKQILTYLRSSGQPRKLLEISIAWAQYSAGTKLSIFYNADDELPHLDAPYLQHIRTFLSDVKASLRISLHGVLPLQWDNKSYIMQVAKDSKQFTDSELVYIN